MASSFVASDSIEFPTHHIGLSRHFFAAWQLRNEVRQKRWKESQRSAQWNNLQPDGAICFSSLHHKIQHLKQEIMSLMVQDTALFRQLFSLQEAVMEFREELETSSDSSSESESLYDSTTMCSEVKKARITSTSSFVRHRVSYPPIARNRSHRVKTTSSHGNQDSYDSGIHNSDLEIFV